MLDRRTQTRSCQEKDHAFLMQEQLRFRELMEVPIVELCRQQHLVQLARKRKEHCHRQSCPFLCHCECVDFRSTPNGSFSGFLTDRRAALGGNFFRVCQASLEFACQTNDDPSGGRENRHGTKNQQSYFCTRSFIQSCWTRTGEAKQSQIYFHSLHCVVLNYPTLPSLHSNINSNDHPTRQVEKNSKRKKYSLH
jgi:hypothetical protein